MKKLVCFFLILLFCSVPVSALESSQDEYYQQQLQDSGAADLPDSLPEETRELLDGMGAGSADWQSIQNLTPEIIFSQIGNVAQEKSAAPLRAALSVLAVMLLCALMNGMKLTFGDHPLGGVIGMVGTLCVCTVVIEPIVRCIGDAALIIKGAAGFLLACVPVLTGIMVAGGQPVSAGSYNLLMVAAGNAISLIAAGVLVPLLNIFLALSIVSAVSPTMNLSGICDMFSKAVKWLLTFCMTVFTGLLTLQTAVSSAADSAGAKTVKFVVSAFVPVVGSALGDAMASVQGCVRLLKSGVGAFGLLAAAAIFLPAIVECLLWMLTLTACSAVGGIFDLKEINSLLKASSGVVGIMLSILLSCLTILVVSSVLMLVIGGGAS